ncbi:MAG TPA: hypothetical protein VJ698_19820 [Noviherbaspirillum sp.]|uniref:hypothetical protein n=1 Tax=Noviherbaspirillum sp. TaxID=1926288 RepID=UPI002B49546C|nr:hypothetical protein [Noviherbaspirillum sp.]HJV87728.1 hypothetical protein [Noviherbaspirillum sp.]
MENFISSEHIVIVRDGEAYRLLHGHLRLANVLRGTGMARVEVKGEGQITVLKTRDGWCADRNGQHLPLRIA